MLLARHSLLRLFWAFLFVAAALLRPNLLAAQAGSHATLGGAVLDPDSKAVVNAAVVIRNEATGEIRTATTDGSGRFSANDLPAGTYTVEVLVPGLKRSAGTAFR